ncbi:peptidase [Pectobacterium brasiliense]|uniref:Peptidase n=1 Tax=Pectobacterium brasiliense TaxID=180957 RepID=A0A094S389_9GAMM|nr:type I secretion system permease/ATPase [Pectobacterium brasiliense]KGA33006.1 peptidase [Pectobacterium brasiliense]KHS75196.1 peptidase [Pectobacterium brasiliense]KHT08731.1 peptidase [Pectobacterium brasiliense]KHT10780.1 peptidase [Pectobacterium brasiliense]
MSQLANKERSLLSILRPFRRSFWSIGIFSAIVNLLMLSPSIYMLQVYDRVLASGNGTTLLMLTLLIAGLGIFMAALEWVRSLVVVRLGTRIDLQLNQQVFNAAFERNLEAGEAKAGQALNDLTLLRQFITGNSLFAFFDIPWFPFFLLVLFLIHPVLGFLALGGTVVLVLLAWLNQYLTTSPLEEANHEALQATHLADTQLRNAEVIESMGMLPNLRRRWLGQHYRFITLQNLASERAAVVGAASKHARIFLQSLMLGVGAMLAIKGEITPGMMIAGSILVGRVLSPIDQLIGIWKPLSSARQAWYRLSRIMTAYPPKAEAMALPAPVGQLSVENVLLQTPQGASRLQDIHFSLQAGETLAILGASGSGKSTLARLLVATQTPTRGKVRLDGADLSQVDKTAFGPAMGYLPQDVQLFKGTLAENISRFGEHDAEKIVAAAKLAGVHEMILSQPQGYDTPLGADGNGLSGGQRQRIALARAVYGDPCLLVLDEPNSSLDNEGEMALAQAISHLQKRGATVILITHRPALTTLAHKILVLNQGKQQRFGPARDILNELQPRRAANQAQMTPAAAVRP